MPTPKRPWGTGLSKLEPMFPNVKFLKKPDSDDRKSNGALFRLETSDFRRKNYKTLFFSFLVLATFYAAKLASSLFLRVPN